MTLVDTNVLLDLVTNDRAWADWSIERLETANLAGPLSINDIIMPNWPSAMSASRTWMLL